MNRLAAEAIGTFWVVFAGCGSAVLGAAFPQLGSGVFGVSFAFGLTVVTMVYAMGHVSGGHLNPAVSVGLLLSKRFPARELPGYMAAQVVGAILGAGVLYLSSPAGGPALSPAAIRCWRGSAPQRCLRLCSS